MDLNYLNQKLRDALGLAPNGDAMFKWLHAKDLTVRQKDKDGQLIDFPQLDEVSMGDGDNPCRPAHRWVLACWQPPQYTLEQYRHVFGDSMPYPRNGRYVVTDIVLQRGAEPNEQVTCDVIGKEKARRWLVESQRRDVFKEGRARSQRRVNEQVAGIIDEARPAFQHAPGMKDHVSLPSHKTAWIGEDGSGNVIHHNVAIGDGR